MGFLYSYRQNNRSRKIDMTIKDNKEKTCKTTDFTFPIDINIFAEEFENLSKC